MGSIVNKLRTVLYTIPLAVACIVPLGVSSVLASLFDRRGETQHRIASWWSRLFLKASGVKVDVSGIEHLPRTGGFVFVANHLSSMDIPLLSAYLPTSFRFMAKTSLFRTPFIGWHLRAGGHIRVIRESKVAAVRSIELARDVVRRGISVVVFAEGTRSAGTLQRFKAGAAHLAIKAGVPVVPVAIVGTDRVMPNNTLQYHPGRVELRIGRPIRTDGLTREDNSSLTNQLRERVSELIGDVVPARG